MGDSLDDLDFPHIANELFDRQCPSSDVKRLLCRPRFDDRDSGKRNAASLNRAGVRPALFDVSCMVYRLLYAKASTYVQATTDERIAHMIAADVIADVADACRVMACGPVMAFDSAHSYRKDLFAAYKAGRGGQKKTPAQERVLNIKPFVMSLLKGVYCPTYRIQQFCVYGYESDDIIASLVLGLKQSDEVRPAAYDGKVVIVSSDGDLHQLLVDGVMWADVAKGVLCDGAAVAKHTGVPPDRVVLAKCVGGCASDAIPGVPGCGEKTVEEVVRSLSFDVKQKKAANALASDFGREILARNLRLIRLPYSASDYPLPPLLLSAGVWPAEGTPDDAAALMERHGVPRHIWPSFPDVRLKRPAGALPCCEWQRRTKDEVQS